MSDRTRPERIAEMRARIAEIERAIAFFRDGLRETNDERHQAYFGPLLHRLVLIVANEKDGIAMYLADDLAGARSALRRLPLPDIDPDLGEPTASLEALRGRRGNLIEALDNALEAAQALGMAPALTELGQLSVPRDAFANALIRLDERLRVVQDAVVDLASAAAQASTGKDGVSQSGLINVHVKSLTVEVSAARFETRIGNSPEIPELSDLAVLTRAVTDIRAMTGDLRQIVEGLAAWVTTEVKSAAGTVVRGAERSWRGLKTVVSVVRRRLAGKPDRAPRQPPPATDPDRALDPLAWATAQNERGDRLFDQGKDDPDSTLLDEAVAAYRAALEEYTRDRVPLDWAMTQNNLGTALETLGERESGTARLDEAVAAYRAALEERTRDRVPLDWAATQYNLANVLATLSERTKDRTRMTEAIASMRNAAEVYRQGNVAYWLPIAEQRIAAMEATLAKMSP